MGAPSAGLKKFKIARFLQLRFEIRDLKSDRLLQDAVQFKISNLEPKLQESCNFKFLGTQPAAHRTILRLPPQELSGPVEQYDR